MSVSEVEERAQFTLRMRACGIRDLAVLRALERAPRALFMPQRYADIAARDFALPIACGQTSPPPSVVAAMIEALGVRRTDRVCEIGAGTGYGSALLAQLAREVVSLERCQALALEAAARMEAFGLANVRVLWADGLAWRHGGERFDRVIVNALVPPPGDGFVDLLTEEGVAVAVVVGRHMGEQRIVRAAREPGGATSLVELGEARAFTPLAPGLSRAA